MRQLNFQVTPQLKAQGEKLTTLRQQCKLFLTKHGVGFDKFTMVSHDTYIGFISEIAIKDYLAQNYSDCIAVVNTWEEAFDLIRIEKIVNALACTQQDIDYVKAYFYDSWDLKIETKKGVIRADVKTAATQKEPRPSWNFMYPLVQVNKTGKDLLILAYYVQSSKDYKDFAKMVLVGGTTPVQVRHCNLIKAGAKTRFGTISQIDNYETELSRDYKDLKAFLC